MLRRGVHIVACGGQLPLRLGKRFRLLRAFFLKLRALLFQPFQLIGARQHARALRRRAARHGAAGIDHLAIERHDAEAVVVFFRDGHGIAQRLRNDRAPQQTGKHAGIGAVIAAKLAGKAKIAPFAARRILQRTAAHRADGQKCGTARILPLQVFNGRAAILLRVHNDVLRRKAQRRFDGQGIAILAANKIGHRPANAGQCAAL